MSREQHRNEIISSDKSLYKKEVTDEKERAMKPFKLMCTACHKPVGSMIVTEKGLRMLFGGQYLMKMRRLGSNSAFQRRVDCTQMQ